MKTITIILFCWLICIPYLFSETFSVGLTDDYDYHTIQSAVNASADGDIIYVAPGRYYENVDCYNKDLIVASFEYSTHDTTYVSRTIIDGNQTGQCIKVNGNNTIRGFTLTNGTGVCLPFSIHDEYWGGGILSWNSSNLQIINCYVYDNNAEYGGGVNLAHSNVTLSGTRIYNNYCTSAGGGLVIDGLSNIIFDQDNLCSIYGNFACFGSDIYARDARQNVNVYLDMFSVNNASPYYAVFYHNVYVNDPYDIFINAQQAYFTEIDHDLYVSPDGNDANSGFSAEQPLKNIAFAMQRITSNTQTPRNIYIMPRIYTPENQDIFFWGVKSYVNLIGTLEQTFFLSRTWTAFIRIGFARNVSIENISISGVPDYYNSGIDLHECTNVTIKNCSLTDMNTLFHGPLDFTNTDKVTLDNVRMERIISTRWGIEASGKFSGVIKNCIFRNISNTESDDPESPVGEIISLVVNDTLTVENCIFQNLATANPYMFVIRICEDPYDSYNVLHINNCLFTGFTGAGGFNLNANCSIQSTITNCTMTSNTISTWFIGLTGNFLFSNNIFANTSPFDIFFGNNPQSVQPLPQIEMNDNLFQGGRQRITYNEPGLENQIIWGYNIDADPMFVGGHPSYRLAENSPCIDTGTADTTGLFLPLTDLAGNYRVWNNRIDMGCYEYGSEPVGNEDEVIPPPLSGISMTNYPNPFNPNTTISFTIPKDAETKLTIYNAKGQVVKTLISGQQKAGQHSIVWNGRDNAGKAVSSGVYLYRLESGKLNTQKKMILMK